MKVIYSIGSKFGGHGIGGVAVYAIRGIYRARALQRVLASYQGKIPNYKFQIPNSKTRIPEKYIRTMGLVGLGLRRLAYYDPTGWGYVLHDNVFDRWAAGQLENCDIFHGWNHHCLRQLRRVREAGGVSRRTVAVVERASSHILQGQEILEEEYKKYDVNVRLLPQMYVKKCLAEYEEADYVLVPSDYAKCSFLERGFDDSKLVKIPFGVGLDRGYPCQTGVTPPKEKFVVLFVGEIRLGKGVQYLLEAWGIGSKRR